MADEQDTVEEVKTRARPDETVTEAKPFVMEYDTPPAAFVPGTEVPKDKEPDEMTDAEYIQWMRDNLTPFWAIKERLLLRHTPVISSIDPTSVEVGANAESFLLIVTGENFVWGHSVIMVNGHDEKTQLNVDGTLSAGINMNYWRIPETVQVTVRNAHRVSNPVEFTFAAAPGSPEAEAQAEAEERAKVDAQRADNPDAEYEDHEDDADDDNSAITGKKRLARKKK